MKYNDRLGHIEQIDMEEAIAAAIFDAASLKDDPLGEEACADLGREILLMVLERFRPDMFVADQTFPPDTAMTSITGVLVEPGGRMASVSGVPKCSWCDKPATAQGTDGTFSCGQGQGDGLEDHCSIKVLYVPLRL